MLLSVLISLHASAANVRLVWDASETADSYKLYYGEAPGLYQHVLDIGPLTHASVGGLRPKVHYFFAATAINAAGESEFSNEIDVVPNPSGNDESHLWSDEWVLAGS
jgi:hypothetical protein